MTELDLIKFIKNNHLEISWRGKELLLWVDFYAIEEFTEMIECYLSEYGETVHLQVKCMAIDMLPVCSHYDINPENICPKEKADV